MIQSKNKRKIKKRPRSISMKAHSQPKNADLGLSRGPRCAWYRSRIEEAEGSWKTRPPPHSPQAAASAIRRSRQPSVTAASSPPPQLLASCADGRGTGSTNPRLRRGNRRGAGSGSHRRKPPPNTTSPRPLHRRVLFPLVRVN